MEQIVSQRANEHESDGATLLRQALALNPLSGGRRNALRAVRLLEQGAEAQPDDPVYPYWCGVIYRSFGLWEKAAMYFERALERQPGHGPSRLELAWVYVQFREFDRARAVLAGMGPVSPAPDTARRTEAKGAGAADLSHDWRFQRLRAILLLVQDRPLEAFEAYPANPPDDIHVTQWWREYLYIAEAAGGLAGPHGDSDARTSADGGAPAGEHRREGTSAATLGNGSADGETRSPGPADPAFVLRRLEQRRAELEMLFGADTRPGPDVEELHYFRALLARLAAAAGNADKADEYRALVPRSSPAYGPVRDMSLRLADSAARRALKRGDLDKAVELWQEALEEEPDNAVRRRWLVHALSRRGARLWEADDPEGAVSCWSEARRRDVSSLELLHNLAIGFERLGRWADANKCREALLQSSSGTSRAATGGAGAARTSAHAGHGSPEAAPDAPGDGGPASGQRGPERGAMLVTMAENAFRAGQINETRRLLEAARASIVPDVTLLTRAGLLYACIGDGGKAVEASLAALELQPGYEPAIQCIVHAARMPGMNDAAALNAMARALHGLPSDSPVFRHWRTRALEYGRRALETGAVDEAMEIFASLLLADAADIDAWLWAGAAHMKHGNASGAEDCFAEAIRLDPDRAATYIDLGARFLAEGDRPRAEGYFEQAVKAAPGPATHVTIGELCAHIGVPDLAEHHLRAALTGDKEAEPFLVRAICGLLETGNEERIRPFLEEAHKIAPDAVQLRILVAVQHLRQHEWVAADDSLREALRLAEERTDEKLLEHVAFFRQALILLRTVGKIDERVFQTQVRALLEQWLAEAAASDAPADELQVEPLETLLARVPDPVDRRPMLPRPGPDDESDGNTSAPMDLSLFLGLHVPPVGRATAN